MRNFAILLHGNLHKLSLQDYGNSSVKAPSALIQELVVASVIKRQIFLPLLLQLPPFCKVLVVDSKSLAPEHLNGQFSMMVAMKSLFVSAIVCMF
jgi:hypothetical protein